jgi:hypothetical protein
VRKLLEGIRFSKLLVCARSFHGKTTSRARSLHYGVYADSKPTLWMFTISSPACRLPVRPRLGAAPWRSVRPVCCRGRRSSAYRPAMPLRDKRRGRPIASDPPHAASHELTEAFSSSFKVHHAGAEGRLLAVMTWSIRPSGGRPMQIVIVARSVDLARNQSPGRGLRRRWRSPLSTRAGRVLRTSPAAGGPARPAGPRRRRGGVGHQGDPSRPRRP